MRAPITGLSSEEVEALLYACEDNWEMYLEDEDEEVRDYGQSLVDLIPELRRLR